MRKPPLLRPVLSAGKPRDFRAVLKMVVNTHFGAAMGLSWAYCHAETAFGNPVAAETAELPESLARVESGKDCRYTEWTSNGFRHVMTSVCVPSLASVGDGK